MILKLLSFSVPHFMHMYTRNNIHPYRMAVRVKGADVCGNALESIGNCKEVFKVTALATLPPSLHQRGNPTLLIAGLMNTKNFLSP